MTKSLTPAVQIYDDFAGPSLDMSKWEFLQFPQVDGSSRICAEPNAVTDLSKGGLRVHVERFEAGHPVQIMDNVKQLLLSTANFRLPTAGVVEFSGQIAAKSINATARDYRDGFVSLVVVDMSSGSVFDVCATSDSVFAIHERLPVPGVDRPYVYVVEQPLAGVVVSPYKVYSCKVLIDTGTRTVRYEVDGTTIFETITPELPETVKLGLGMFTLHPVNGESSGSLRGQGLSGLWRNVGTSAPPA